MRSNIKDIFTTIKSEGIILPISTLQKIISLDIEIDGLKPVDYNLSPTERINEAISRSWQRITTLWKRFNDQFAKLPLKEVGTSITRERWMLPLFQELGYGNLPLSKGFEINGKAYPISHAGNNVAIHLVGYNVKLDERTAGVAGAARMSPHSLVQLFLNSSKDYLWGIVSNGNILRLLRDDISITRQSYIEFDLKSMLEGEVYSDFVLLWLLCHQTRFISNKPEDSYIEKWSKLSQQTGARVLEQLGNGVVNAIRSLGIGFLKHPSNKTIREKLASGQLDRQDYYRELLRLVYRIIFLCVAEDRDILLDPKASANRKELYLRYYSVSRIRNLARNFDGNNHSDIFEGLKIVMNGLEGKSGLDVIGLPALGSKMWSDKFIENLRDNLIENRYFIKAIQELTFTTENGYKMPVNFKNLGPEELGSVYESLLEMQPEVDITAGIFELNIVAGNDRKITGSYYTPTSLINCILDSALEPVIAKARKKGDPEKAILAIKVCDPACGSGHFLVAAAHRIAKHLAAIRTGDEEPSPSSRRHALRDVISHCIYGVDINEMSAELCRINLWLESLEPGRPLAFLEHHIQSGNSLFGTTPELMEKGIPMEAFEALEGDNKVICSAIKKLNKKEREQGLGYSLTDGLHFTTEMVKSLGEAAATFDNISDDSFNEVESKVSSYSEFINSEAYKQLKFIADLWCAAFVCEKKDKKIVITENTYQRSIRQYDHLEKGIFEMVDNLANKYNMFHWHLAFPEVFLSNEKKGFDVVLGNPPWERIGVQEIEWFAQRIPQIANTRNSSERKMMIKKLEEENKVVYEAFLNDKRLAEGESHYLRNSGVYPLCGRGDINTYSVFTELMTHIKTKDGYVGCIVPTGIATDDTTKLFFQSIVDREALISLYDFENRQEIFKGVHRSYKFCLLTISEDKSKVKRKVELMFFAQNVDDINNLEKRFQLTSDEISLLNPNTHTCPIFRNNRDVKIAKEVYKNIPVLKSDKGTKDSEWNIEFNLMFSMSADSHLFVRRPQLIANYYKLIGNQYVNDSDTYFPLYEAKMFHQYNHRYGTYEGVQENSTNNSLPSPTQAQYNNIKYCVLPRYWIEYRKVVRHIYDAPQELVGAFYKEDYDTMKYVIQHWITGYFLNNKIDISKRRNIKDIIIDSKIIKKDKATSLENEYRLTASEIKNIESDSDLKDITMKILQGRKYKWFITFRDIARTTDERTFISTVLPIVAIGNNAPVISYKIDKKGIIFCLLMNMNSLMFDYIVRLKAGGVHMNFFIVKQLPVLKPDDYDNRKINGELFIDWLRPRAGKLICNSVEMIGFAEDIGLGQYCITWDEEERFQTRCEVDAAFFRMYNISRDDVDYILDTFPIIKSKDVQRYGTYRTKDIILKYYDNMVIEK
jgi:type I restriction-modification system DNA methylase subunit